MKTLKRVLSVAVILTMLFSMLSINTFAASTAHTVTIAASATTVKAGDTITVTATIDKTEKIISIGYKLAFPNAAFVVDTATNESVLNDWGVDIPMATDVEWFEGYEDLRNTKKWETYAMGSEVKDGATAVIFGGTKSSGITAANSTANMEIGKYNVKIADNVAPGTYQIYMYEATTCDEGESLGTDFIVAPLTITVEGAPAPEPVMSGITAVADGVEVAYADKDNADVIKAAIANALTVKAQWTEGKADTDVAVADVTITVDTAATKATVAYEGFTADVTYTVAAKPVVYFTVTFKAEDAEDVVIEVEEGAAIGDALATATKEGFVFVGWFTDEGEEITAETVVNADIVATAKFTRIEGDVNCDGAYNSKDAIYLLNYVILPELYDIAEYLEYYDDVDFNGDGKVTSQDAIQLLNNIVVPALYTLK